MKPDRAAIEFVKQELEAADAHAARLREMLARMMGEADVVSVDDVDGPWLTPKQAAALVNRNVSTVTRWVEKYGIGRRNGGRLEVSRPRLEAIARHR